MSSVAGVARCDTSGVPAQGSECVHFGESNGSTIWISHHDESPPCGLLRGPEDRNAKSLGLFFPPVRVPDLEAQRRCPCCRPRRKNASVVVTPIVSVQHDLSRGPTDDDEDLVFQPDREPEDVDVERLRLAEVSNKEDEAVVIVNSHHPRLPKMPLCGPIERRSRATRDHRLGETSAPSLAGRGPQLACWCSARCAALGLYRDLVPVVVLRYPTTRWL